MSEEEHFEPRVVVESRGIIFILFLIVISMFMIFYGAQYNMSGLVLWGYVLFFSLLLALIPIFVRILIPKTMAEAIKQAEFERELQKRIKRYEEKQKQNQN